MLQIKEIQELQRTVDDSVIQNASFEAVVIEVGEVVKPKNSSIRPRFSAILADTTASISITVYDEVSHRKFITGFGVKIEKAIVKKNYLAVTTQSDVSLIRGFEIPDEVKHSAPKLVGTKEMLLQVATASPVKTLADVKGKVVQISPVTTKNVYDKQLKFQEMELQDKSGTATVALWDNMTDVIEPGQLIKLSNCRVKLFQEKKKLTTTQKSAYELLSADPSLEDLPELDVNTLPKPWSADPLEEVTLDSIYDADPYMACPKQSCGNKKLETVLVGDKYLMHCQTCDNNMEASKCSFYAVATFITKKNDQRVKLSMFLPEIKKTYESSGKAFTFTFNKQDMLLEILSILPITLNCRLRQNTIVKVVPKHRIEEQH